jgi:conserved oligomeric Golgi complex subunit 6
MSPNRVSSRDGADVYSDSLASPTGTSAKSSALSNKITALLSFSFSDSELRDALAILDTRRIQNTADTRRNLAQDAQKELLDVNSEIVADFGKVADVRFLLSPGLGKVLTRSFSN